MPTLDYYDPKPILDLPEEAWRRIERALDLEKPNLDLRCRVASYVSLNLTGLYASRPQVRRKALRSWINRIRADAARLIHDLEFPDDDSDDAYAQTYVALSLLDPSKRKELLADLSALVTEAERALRAVPADRGGRLPDANLTGLIYDLASAYEIATGQKPTITTDSSHLQDRYSGRFFEFVHAVLRQFAPQYVRGDQALGKSIKRALRIWRR